MTPYDNAEALLREPSAPRRNQFFYGKRMDVQHFRMEQDYGRLKRGMLNRLSLGTGVVCGLKVTLESSSPVVAPGLAIDGLGREIVVPMRTAVDLVAAARAGGLEPEDARAGVFTLWLCYRECSADFQPVLVSDCDTRSDCAPGTTVESFGFKLTKGLAPLQTDPTWCAGVSHGEPRPAPTPQPTPTPQPVPALHPADALLAALTDPRSSSLDAVQDALASWRHALCEATARACEPESDVCVPLAAILVDDGPRLVENCLVRPRVYSNALLTDLVLCLAQKIDECCKTKRPADLMRVTAIDFLRRGRDGEATVASVTSPLNVTQVRIGGRTNAIRIAFSKPFAQDARRPTTPGPDDAQFKRHNVLIVPEQPLQGIEYVAGMLTIESPQVVRFDLADRPPYARGGALGWQKGRYRILLAGKDAAADGRLALADLSGVALDGEPIAPSSGALSGDGTAAGDFFAAFSVN